MLFYFELVRFALRSFVCSVPRVSPLFVHSFVFSVSLSAPTCFLINIAMCCSINTNALSPPPQICFEANNSDQNPPRHCASERVERSASTNKVQSSPLLGTSTPLYALFGSGSPACRGTVAYYQAPVSIKHLCLIVCRFHV